jgi:cytoskeleton protein RodZ
MNESMNSEPLAPTAGAVLASARARSGLSLQDVATRTRISRTTLEAIEGERWSELPGEAYVRGFVKIYAREVGLDPRVPLALMDGAKAEVVVAEEAATRAQDVADRADTWSAVRVRAAYALVVGTLIAVTLATLFSVSPPRLEAKVLDRGAPGAVRP